MKILSIYLSLLFISFSSFSQVLIDPDYAKLAKENLENESTFDDLGFSSKDLPKSYSLEEYALVSDQGPESSCVGYAVTGAMQIIYNMLNKYDSQSFDKKVVNKFDAHYVYASVKSTTDLDCIRGDGCECGSWPDDALEIIKNYGCKKLGLYPELQCSATLTKGNLRSMVNMTGHYSIDGYVNLVEYYKTRTGDWAVDVDVNAIKLAIANNNPVITGMRVKDDFGDLNKGNQPYAATQGDSGGHAVTVIGYNDSKYGGAFRVLNSYGYDWGDDGYFWITYKEFRDIVDAAYIMVKEDWSEWTSSVSNGSFFKGPNKSGSLYWEGNLNSDRMFHGSGVVMGEDYSAFGYYKDGVENGWWVWYDNPNRKDSWAGYVLFKDGEVMEVEDFGFSTPGVEDLSTRKNALHIETLDLNLSDEPGEKDDFSKKSLKSIKDAKK